VALPEVTEAGGVIAAGRTALPSSGGPVRPAPIMVAAGSHDRRVSHLDALSRTTPCGSR